MLANYAFIGLFFIAAATFPILPLVAARFLRPSRPTEIKLDTYECGVETEGPSNVQFHVGYYVFALLFVVFDVETLLLYPWAVSLGKTAVFGLLNGLLFIVILGIGLAYDWRKKALEFK